MHECTHVAVNIDEHSHKVSLIVPPYLTTCKNTWVKLYILHSSFLLSLERILHRGHEIAQPVDREQVW